MSGPWTKLSDQQRYVDAVRPKMIIAIHDVTLNELGLDFAQRSVERLASAVGASPVALAPGESVVLG